MIHLAPLDPQPLRPGDFYLQVAPFSDQSARIVVCSLLEEECLREEVLIEETPIPETSYPCIFSLEWLAEVNQDRNGTPLSQCLVATEQGVVRLSWKRVAVPEFVDESRRDRSIMATAPPSFTSIPPSLPSSSKLSLPVSVSAPKEYPLTTPPSTFSVQTRIYPAKHGIAVSLCLVDTSAASSSRQLKVKDSDVEAKPIGWVAPNTWDSRCTGKDIKDSKETKTESSVSDMNIVKSSSGDQINNIPEGEYIDIMQATMLFGQSQSSNEQNEKQLERQQFRQMQKFPQMQTSQRQTEPYMQTQGQPVPYMSPQLPPRPHPHSPPSLSMSAKTVPAAAANYHSHLDSPDTPPCLRSVRFSEKPCTPCMKRKQGLTVSKAQELRCRYRDSYQAAIQNPIKLTQDKARAAMCPVLEEDCDTAQVPNNNGPMRRGLWGGSQGLWPQAAICEESGEKNTYWKPRDNVPCVDYGGADGTKKEQTNERTTVTLREPWDIRTTVNGTRENVTNVLPNQAQHYGYCSNETPGINTNLCEQLQNRAISFRASSNVYLPAPQSRRGSVLSDGRCSSLSTAVVDTSEKCDVVIMDGQRVRRKENTGSSVEVPQLHVVKCKNSTAFRLVSPKLHRRKLAVPGKDAVIKHKLDKSSSNVISPGGNNLIMINVDFVLLPALPYKYKYSKIQTFFCIDYNVIK